MTDLYDRLFPTGSEENIAAHYLFAALVIYAIGSITRVQIVNHWALDSEAAADLDTLCDAVDALDSVGKMAFGIKLHAIMMLAEAGVLYTTKAEFAAELGL